MKKTIYAGVIALFLTLSTICVNAGDGHDVGKCTNPCTQSATSGTNTAAESSSVGITATLIQIVVSLLPKG